jgi:hypothetical protein
LQLSPPRDHSLSKQWLAPSNYVGAGIASAVPYTANLNWGDVGLSFFADGLSESQQERNVETTGAVSGQLVVEIKIIAGATNLGPNRPLGAGEYSDVISIEVGPL